LPGAAEKGRKVRELLEQGGRNPPPWGEARGTVVVLHGHIGRKEDSLPICERFCAAGFRCVVPDLPGHGDNPAACATFGKTECALAEELLEDAAARFAFAPRPALLFGVSQGGAIALQTAARPGGRWAGVCSVAAFATLDRPLAKSSEDLAGPLGPLAGWACQVGVRCRAGFSPAEIRPLDAARRITVPTFIAHGEQDSFISPSNAREIFDAIPHSRKTLRMVPAGSHHDVLAAGSHPLYAEICGFFLDCTLQSP
jgi:pimeloyl-ACP methyl ester carboxylesterase